MPPGHIFSHTRKSRSAPLRHASLSFLYLFLAISLAFAGDNKGITGEAIRPPQKGGTYMDVIRTASLCKCYGRLPAVDHLEMHVPKGAIYGFIGRNGSGKSPR